MSTIVSVRHANDDDQPALRELSARAVATLRQVYRPTPVAIGAKHARRANRQCLVAMIGPITVGYLEFETRPDALRLLGPMVDPDHRRQGVARALISQLIAIARNTGTARLSLATIEQTGNVEIFTKLGFHVVSRAPVTDAISVKNEPLVDVEMELVVSSLAGSDHRMA